MIGSCTGIECLQTSPIVRERSRFTSPLPMPARTALGHPGGPALRGSFTAPASSVLMVCDLEASVGGAIGRLPVTPGKDNTAGERQRGCRGVSPSAAFLPSGTGKGLREEGEEADHPCASISHVSPTYDCHMRSFRQVTGGPRCLLLLLLWSSSLQPLPSPHALSSNL